MPHTDKGSPVLVGSGDVLDDSAVRLLRHGRTVSRAAPLSRRNKISRSESRSHVSDGRPISPIDLDLSPRINSRKSSIHTQADPADMSYEESPQTSDQHLTPKQDPPLALPIPPSRPPSSLSYTSNSDRERRPVPRPFSRTSSRAPSLASVRAQSVVDDDISDSVMDDDIDDHRAPSGREPWSTSPAPRVLGNNDLALNHSVRSYDPESLLLDSAPVFLDLRNAVVNGVLHHNEEYPAGRADDLHTSDATRATRYLDCIFGSLLLTIERRALTPSEPWRHEDAVKVCEQMAHSATEFASDISRTLDVLLNRTRSDATSAGSNTNRKRREPTPSLLPDLPDFTNRIRSDPTLHVIVGFIEGIANRLAKTIDIQNESTGVLQEHRARLGTLERNAATQMAVGKPGALDRDEAARSVFRSLHGFDDASCAAIHAPPLAYATADPVIGVVPQRIARVPAMRVEPLSTQTAAIYPPPPPPPTHALHDLKPPSVPRHPSEDDPISQDDFPPLPGGGGGIEGTNSKPNAPRRSTNGGGQLLPDWTAPERDTPWSIKSKGKGKGKFPVHNSFASTVPKGAVNKSAVPVVSGKTIAAAIKHNVADTHTTGGRPDGHNFTVDFFNNQKLISPAFRRMWTGPAVIAAVESQGHAQKGWGKGNFRVLHAAWTSKGNLSLTFPYSVNPADVLAHQEVLMSRLKFNTPWTLRNDVSWSKLLLHNVPTSTGDRVFSSGHLGELIKEAYPELKAVRYTHGPNWLGQVGPRRHGSVKFSFEDPDGSIGHSVLTAEGTRFVFGTPVRMNRWNDKAVLRVCTRCLSYDHFTETCKAANQHCSTCSLAHPDTQHDAKCKKCIAEHAPKGSKCKHPSKCKVCGGPHPFNSDACETKRKYRTSVRDTLRNAGMVDTERGPAFPPPLVPRARIDDPELVPAGLASSSHAPLLAPLTPNTAKGWKDLEAEDIRARGAPCPIADHAIFVDAPSEEDLAPFSQDTEMSNEYDNQPTDAPITSSVTVAE